MGTLSNKTKSQVSTQATQPDGNKGMIYVIAIAAGIVLLNIFYTVWDAVEGYSVTGDVIAIIFSVVVGLCILSGQPWMRFVFAAMCIYYAFFRIINLIFIVGEMSTQDLDLFLLIVQSVTLLYFGFCVYMLLGNKNVKAYFSPEK